MKKYLFVVAIQDPQDKQEPLAFAHAFVTADDESDAYAKGGRLYESGDLINHVPEFVGVNDYVVELPHKLEI